MYDETNFGNAAVVLGSGDLHLRIVRDKGKLFLDIGSPYDEAVWFDLNDVMAEVNRGNGGTIGESVAIYNVTKEDVQYTEMAQVLRNNLPEIIVLSQMPQTMEVVIYTVAKAASQGLDYSSRLIWPQGSRAHPRDPYPFAL